MTGPSDSGSTGPSQGGPSFLMAEGVWAGLSAVSVCPRGEAGHAGYLEAADLEVERRGKAGKGQVHLEREQCWHRVRKLAPRGLTLFHLCPQPSTGTWARGGPCTPRLLHPTSPAETPLVWASRLVPLLSHHLPSLLSSCSSLPTAFWKLLQASCLDLDPPAFVSPSGRWVPALGLLPTDRASETRVQPCVSLAGREGSGVLPPTGPAGAGGEAREWGPVHLRAVPYGWAGLAGR